MNTTGTRKRFKLHAQHIAIIKVWHLVSKQFSEKYGKEISDYEMEMKLRFVRIYFDATSFDKVVQDRADKPIDILSAIGGTMGLLTGFSIISGVEIVYFVFKMVLNNMMGLFKRNKKKTVV